MLSVAPTLPTQAEFPGHLSPPFRTSRRVNQGPSTGRYFSQSGVATNLSSSESIAQLQSESFYQKDEATGSRWLPLKTRFSALKERFSRQISETEYDSMNITRLIDRVSINRVQSRYRWSTPYSFISISSRYLSCLPPIVIQTLCPHFVSIRYIDPRNYLEVKLKDEEESTSKVDRSWSDTSGSVFKSSSISPQKQRSDLFPSPFKYT